MSEGSVVNPSTLSGQLITAVNQEAGQFLRRQAGGTVDALVVLGSGLARTLDGGDGWGEPVASFPLSKIPGVPAPVADGHIDEFRIYRRPGGLCVGVALGRTHLYEGHGPEPVTALVKGAYCSGIEMAVLCNANGCLREWELGDVMAIHDHVNFSGTSPFNGTVFLDTTTCWDRRLTAALSSVCSRSGTYAFLRGPEYQTPAETRLLATAEVDAVGMSSVMEALVLHALGVRVCGMSVVSDLSFATTSTDPMSVIQAAATAGRTVLAGIESALAAGESPDPQQIPL